MKNGLDSYKKLGSPIDVPDQHRMPKRPNVFSKGIKKLTKSTSILNMNQLEEDSASKQERNKDDHFQAIGYETVSADSKEPIHVMYLPERTVPSPRQVSLGSQSSHEGRINQNLQAESENYANSMTSSSAGSFSSLDPRSRSTSQNDNQVGLATIGLHLAGYGLSTDDFMPPPLLKPLVINNGSQSSNTLHTIYQNESTSSLPEKGYSSFIPPTVRSSNTLPSISTGNKSRAKQSSRSTSHSQHYAAPKTTPSGSSHSLQAFTAVASNMNQVPKSEIVDQLFERLLSTRVFTDKAVKTLKEQSTKRKWELLLRENETNSDFDLKSFTRSISLSINCAPHSDSSNQRESKSSEQQNALDNKNQQDSKSLDFKGHHYSDIKDRDGDDQRVKQHSAIKTISRIGGESKKNIMDEGAYSKVKKKSVDSSAPSDLDTGTSASLHKKQKLREGSPEWFVARIMSNKLTLKEYKKLEKKLHENSVSPKYEFPWVQKFNEAQGETALSVILSRINRKSIKSNEEFDKEYIIVKCLKNILNAERQEDEVTDDSESVHSIALKNKSHVIKSMIFSLISPRLATRILVTEVLIFLSYYKNSELLPNILGSMVNLQDLLGDFVRFQPWLNSLESFLDQYFTSSGDTRLVGDHNFKNYSLTTLLLINSIIEGTKQIKKRIALRREFNDSRLLKVFDKLRVFNNDRINEEIEKYEAYAEEDYTDFFNLGNNFKSSGSSEFDVSLDELYNGLKKEFHDKDDEDSNELHIKSIFQKFLMLKDSGRSEPEINKLLILIDSVMQHIIAESTMIGSDANSVLNSSIQRLIDRLTTDDTARRAILETKELTKSLKILEEEKKQLELEASFGLNQTVANLKRENQLSASKIASQEKQIGLLQYQIRKLEEEKNKVAKKVDNSISASLLSSAILKMNTGSAKSKDIVHELESVFSSKQNSAKRITIDLSKDDLYINNDDISIIEERIHQPKSSASIETISKQNQDSLLDLNDKLDNALKPQVSAVSPKLLTTETVEQSVSTISAPPLPPPPPPPLPPLFLTSSTSDKDEKSVMQVLPPSPLPSFMNSPQAISSPTSKDLPPPPPMPSFMNKLSTPPPPPPLPSLFKSSVPNSITSSPASKLDTPPPPPPPLPPTLSGNGSNSISNTPTKQKKAFIECSSNMSTTMSADTESLSRDDASNNLLSVVRPKTKLKQMHWDRIEDINKTFWTDIEHDKLSDILLEKGILGEVEKVFVAKSPAIKLKKDVKSTKSNNSNSDNTVNRKVSYLSRDLAQQFGINLHMFANLSVEELILKVLHCDKEIFENISVLEFFNSDNLTEISDSMFRNFSPYSLDFSKPDKKSLKDPEELERPDRIYLELCFNMKHYWKSRSRALLLIQSYQKDYLDLLKKLQLIDEANKNLRKSDSLRNVLGIIRSVGNFMNDFSKQALGFKLDTLQRLKFMKDDKNSMNFLNYIEKIIRNTFPEFGSFVDELNSLHFIQNISIEQLENDCQDFEKVINNVASSISKGNLSDPRLLHPEDRILSKVSAPLENAKIKNSLLQSHLVRTINEFNSLVEYFGENSKDTNSRNNFFNKFVTFINEFKKAHIENIQREEDQRAYEARKKMIEESKSRVNRGGWKKKKPESNKEDKEDTEEEIEVTVEDDADQGEEPASPSDTSSTDSSNAVIDSLLQRLKSSAPSMSSSSSSSKERKTRNRRSKALSFYSTMSLDDLLEQVSSRSKGSLPKQQAAFNEYESVSTLKRRLTTRKKQTDSSTLNYKADQIMLRAQVMLNQLRNERNASNDSVDSVITSDDIQESASDDASEHLVDSSPQKQDLSVNINDATN